MTTYVHRLEKGGKGVFEEAWYVLNMIRQETDAYPASMPGPNEDMKLRDWWKKAKKRGDHVPWHFGFTDVWQAFPYFPKRSHQILEEQDVLVRIYKVPRRYFKEGTAQAIFRKDKAECVATLRPTEWTKWTPPGRARPVLKEAA